jgi:hypothetical protein
MNKFLIALLLILDVVLIQWTEILSTAGSRKYFSLVSICLIISWSSYWFLVINLLIFVVAIIDWLICNAFYFSEGSNLLLTVWAHTVGISLRWNALRLGLWNIFTRHSLWDKHTLFILGLSPIVSIWGQKVIRTNVETAIIIQTNQPIRNLSSIGHFDISLELLDGLQKVDLVSCTVNKIANWRIMFWHWRLIYTFFDALDNTVNHILLMDFANRDANLRKGSPSPYLQYSTLVDAHVLTFNYKIAYFSWKLVIS